MNFGQKLRTLRNEKHLTQQQLADLLGMTKGNISYYENDIKAPPSDIIVKISRIFHVTTDYLLGNETNQTISVAGLNDEEISLVKQMVNILQKK